jgi:hypothetical protein
MYCANSQFIPNNGDVLQYSSFYVPQSPSKHDTTFKITVTEDTIINGKNCKKFVSDYTLCSNFEFKAYVFEQDSVVCFFKDGDETYDTLYDFTKKKNQHWKIEYSDYHYFIVQVDSVYNTLLKGKSYKTMDVTYFIYERVTGSQEFRNLNKYCSKIMEKFGDLSYYFHMTVAESDCFVSYVSDGLSKYIISSSDTIDLLSIDLNCQPSVINSILKKNNTIQTIEIYPSYTSTKIYLKSGNNLANIEQAVILDSKGLEYLVQIKANEIDVSSLPSGLYFLKLENQSYKFIKE